MVKFTATLPVFRTDAQPRRWGWKDGEEAYYGKRSAPFFNPLIEKLRKKLKSQKLNFTEVSDGEFITFTTI